MILTYDFNTFVRLFCGNSMNNSETYLQKVAMIIEWYPCSHNWKPYLMLKNSQKMFFWIFIKKYGIYWSVCKYTQTDLWRRLRCVEFFDYITKTHDCVMIKDSIAEIGSVFHKMILIRVWTTWKERRELLSFYPKK